MNNYICIGYVCIISMYMNKKYVEDKLLILSYKKEDRYIYNRTIGSWLHLDSKKYHKITT